MNFFMSNSKFVHGSKTECYFMNEVYLYHFVYKISHKYEWLHFLLRKCKSSNEI